MIADPEKLWARRVNPPRVLYLVLTSLRRAAHSLAERGAGRHLFGEDERDLAPPARLLAAGGNRDVSLMAVARAMTLVRLFFYRPAEAQRNKSTSRPDLSKQQTVCLLDTDVEGHLVHAVLSIMVIKAVEYSH